MKQSQSLVLFHQNTVRRHWDGGKELWYFSVVDVVQILTDSTIPRRYWSDLKTKLQAEGSEVYEKIVQLKMTAPDGKQRETDCLSTEDLFRVIQSIPSPKAEPFKLWLARVGYERIQEIEDPELATKRTRALYKAKGYSNNWIEKRMRGIAIREELTDEWQKRDVKGQIEYAILTSEISKAAFGVTPNEYKKLKGLARENLRDHMNDLELIFSMLGEAATTEITRNKNARGFKQSKKAAREGGQVAGRARKDLESKTGKKVISQENYLPKPPVKLIKIEKSDEGQKKETK